MKTRTDVGFTLVEIAVAVAVLGLALTSLIGLQTRMLDTYYNEHRRIQASLYGQYLMTMIEAGPEVPEVETKEGKLRTLLDEKGYFDNEDSFGGKDPMKGWNYQMTVSSIDLPLLADALRRIDLSISWGEGEDEQFALVYFMSNLTSKQSSSIYGQSASSL